MIRPQIDRSGPRRERCERTESPTSRRGFLYLSACTGAIVLASGSGLADEHDPRITVDLEDDSLDVGETTTAELAFSGVPEDFLGFEIRISADSDVASVREVELDERFTGNDTLRSTEVEDGVGTVSAMTVDGIDGDESAPITLATAEIEAEAAGDATVAVEIVRLERVVEDDEDPTIEADAGSAALSVEGDGDETGDGDDDGETTDDGDDGLPGFGAVAALAGIAGGVGYAVRERARRVGGD